MWDSLAWVEQFRMASESRDVALLFKRVFEEPAYKGAFERVIVG